MDEEGTLNGMEGLFSAILAEDGGTQSEDGKPDQTEHTALSAAYVGPCDSAAQEGLSSFFAQPWWDESASGKKQRHMASNTGLLYDKGEIALVHAPGCSIPIKNLQQGKLWDDIIGNRVSTVSHNIDVASWR